VFFSGRILIPLPDDWFKINFDITISLLEILSLFKHRFAELLMIIIYDDFSSESYLFAKLWRKLLQSNCIVTNLFSSY
jgi:hypothetical protein